MTVENCPYCGGNVNIVDSIIIYGRSYGMVWLCQPCDAYVGVQKGTERPLGTLANRELREWRKQAHSIFDPIWKSNGSGKEKREKRKDAYRYMIKIMNIPSKLAHIAMFDIEQCKKLILIIGGEKILQMCSRRLGYSLS